MHERTGLRACVQVQLYGVTCGCGCASGSLQTNQEQRAPDAWPVHRVWQGADSGASHVPSQSQAFQHLASPDLLLCRQLLSCSTYCVRLMSPGTLCAQ